MCFQKFSDNKKIYFCKTFYTHKMYEQKRIQLSLTKLRFFLELHCLDIQNHDSSLLRSGNQHFKIGECAPIDSLLSYTSL